MILGILTSDKNFKFKSNPTQIAFDNDTNCFDAVMLNS